MYIHATSRRSLMSRQIAKLISRPLVLASAALFIHIGVATAADPKTTPTPDAQELARELLLGSNGSRVKGAEAPNYSEVAGSAGVTASQKRAAVQADGQAAARELLLGQHPASHASAAGATASQRRP